MKAELNWKQSLKLALVGTGALLCLTPIAGATELNRSAASVAAPTNSGSIKIALNAGCPESESVYVAAETKNFLVFICGSDEPYTYVGVAKNGKGNITLPLQSYNPQGGPEASRFVAFNRNTRYVLTRNELRVTQGNRTIVRERIIRWN
jgi:hypothetical protein